MKKITKDMTIAETLEVCPESVEVFLSHGLHCIGCHGGAFESIEQGAKGHGMKDAQIKKMVDDINKLASKKKSKDCDCGHDCECE